jgi:hypothetical protein
MPTTSSLQAVPVPTVSDAPLVPSNMLTHVQYMEKRLVMRFTDTSDRDSKILSGGRESGMVAYLTSTKMFTFFDGTSWLNMVASLLSPVINPVDAVSSGGQVTLRGAGSNRSWGIKSNANELHFRYDFEGTPLTVMSLNSTGMTIGAGLLFVKDGTVQPTLRSGSAAPNNAVGVDGDWYAMF